MPATDPEGSFRTHWNYICALAGEAGKPAGTPPSAALSNLAATASGILTPGFDAKPTAACDTDQVRRSLINAWGTEALVAYASDVFTDDDAVRVANHWAVIQAYYVFYHLTQALHVAAGNDRPHDHPKTLNLFSARWIERKLQLHPWSLGHGVSGWRGSKPSGPPGNVPSNLTSCTPGNQYDFAGLCVRATRNRLVDEAKRRSETTRSRTAARRGRRKPPS